MTRSIRTVMFATALAIIAFGARAYDFTLATNTTTVASVMVLPPVYDPGLSWAQIPQRTTNASVAAGAYYRVGRQIIVAAHAGTITNGTTSVSTVVTNGAVISTNTVTSIVAITVPDVGISDYDGTVRWFKVPASRDRARVRVAISLPDTGATVTLSDGIGNALTYTASASDDGFVNYKRALYASKADATNLCTITVFPW